MILDPLPGGTPSNRDYDMQEGYRILNYKIGASKMSLMCYKRKDLMKMRLKTKTLDRYPPKNQDRSYYPYPEIDAFCFPQGIKLLTQAIIP